MADVTPRVPLEDQTHEQFWRQLLRWMVDGVPDAVDVRLTGRVEPGEPVQLEATVVDKSFVGVNDASVVAHVARPNGQSLNVPLQWTGDRDGQYRGSFVSAEAGAYEVTVDASRGAESIGTGVSYVRAVAGEGEYFDPTMHPAPLRRVAEETAGASTRRTPCRSWLRHPICGRADSARGRELWNMPIILVGLMTLLIAEWVIGGGGAQLDGREPEPEAGRRSRLHNAARILLIVFGLAGDPDHGKSFTRGATRWPIRRSGSGGRDRLVYLVELPLRATRGQRRSTRDEVTKASRGSRQRPARTTWCSSR